MGVAGEAMNTYSNRPGETDSISIADSDNTVSPPVYFRSFSFSPDVLIRFEYHGKQVDLGRHGPLAGLLVGLAQLNCSQLTLKRLSHRHGLVFKSYFIFRVELFLKENINLKIDF